MNTRDTLATELKRWREIRDLNREMDRIIVLDQGRIVEEGTHQTLLEKSGTYAELWKHQAGGFIQDSIEA